MERDQDVQKLIDNLAEEWFESTADGRQCATCKSPKVMPSDFRDDLSRREFGISFMCQQCQDEVFC